MLGAAAGVGEMDGQLGGVLALVRGAIGVRLDAGRQRGPGDRLERAHPFFRRPHARRRLLDGRARRERDLHVELAGQGLRDEVRGERRGTPARDHECQ
jgi:hypothetical protein